MDTPGNLYCVLQIPGLGGIRQKDAWAAGNLSAGMHPGQGKLVLSTSPFLSPHLNSKAKGLEVALPLQTQFPSAQVNLFAGDKEISSLPSSEVCRQYP